MRRCANCATLVEDDYPYKLCPVCQAAHTAGEAARQALCVLQGRCVSCGRPADKTLCPVCRAKRKAAVSGR